MFRRYSSITLALPVVLLLSFRLFAEEAPLSLQGLLLRTRDYNPELVEARQAWKVSLAQIRPAGAWPDPTFSYISEEFPSGTPGEAPMKMRHYRIEQMVPFPGKQTIEAKMKYHEGVMAEATYRAKALEIFRDVRMRYYQLALTDQKIDLARESVEILRNALKTAQNRLAAARTSASDVFMAETELHKMENNLYQLQQQRVLIAIELSTLLNQPTDSPMGRPAKIELTDLPIDLKDFQALARRNAPQFTNAEHEILHSAAQRRRSRLAWAPDFGFMAERETAPEGGEPGHQIGFSVTFPLWVTRPWGQSKAGQEHLAEAQASRQAMENMVIKNVHSEVVATQMHLTMARRYERDILPSALSNLRITRQQYTSGQADIMRMLEAFRSWIEAQNMYQDEVYQYGEHWAELGRWIGLDVSRAKEALDQHEIMPMEENSHEK